MKKLLVMIQYITYQYNNKNLLKLYMKKVKSFFQVKKPGDYLKYEIMGFILLVVIIALMMVYLPRIFGEKEDNN